MINVVNPQQQTYHLGMVCEIWPTTLRTYVQERDWAGYVMKHHETISHRHTVFSQGLCGFSHQIISFRCPQKTFPDRGAVVWKLGYIHWWIIIKLAMFLGWIIHMPDITVSYSQRPVGYTHKMCCCRPCSTWSASLVVASRILLCRRQGFCFWILGSGGSCRGQTWNFHGICWSLSDPSYLISA